MRTGGDVTRVAARPHPAQFGAGSRSTPAGNGAMTRKTETQQNPRSASEQRTDEAIWEDIHDHLTMNHDLDATEIEIVVEDGNVTLTGRVDTREAKWLAEEIARGVAGVTDLHNRLKVARL
jgi:osmotically-inducible protein OsmY